MAGDFRLWSPDGFEYTSKWPELYHKFSLLGSGPRSAVWTPVSRRTMTANHHIFDGLIRHPTGHAIAAELPLTQGKGSVLVRRKLGGRARFQPCRKRAFL